jgi:hypothetical protein
MRSFWQLISLILIGLMTSCGGVQYWTYTTNNTPSYITHPVYIPVWIDQSFTGTQVEEIRAAIKEWNYVLNGHIVIYLAEKKAMGSDKKMYNYPDSFVSFEHGQAIENQCKKIGLGWVIYNIPSTDKHYDKNIGSSVLAYVEREDEHSIVIISDRFGSRSMKDIVMHEIAHLLGADHVNAPSLEYPYYSQYQYSCIDKITVAQVAKKRDIPFEQLQYCLTPNFL